MHFKLLEKNKRKFNRLCFLKFMISVRGGHCYCWLRSSKNLATPLIIAIPLLPAMPSWHVVRRNLPFQCTRFKYCGLFRRGDWQLPTFRRIVLFGLKGAAHSPPISSTGYNWHKRNFNETVCCLGPCSWKEDNLLALWHRRDTKSAVCTVY